jgi:hypothetical protein
MHIEPCYIAPMIRIVSFIIGLLVAAAIVPKALATELDYGYSISRLPDRAELEQIAADFIKQVENYGVCADTPSNDKVYHCGVSCVLSARYGAVTAMMIGIAKEVEDIFTPGDADMKNLDADYAGVSIGRHFQDDYKLLDACAQRCVQVILK